VLSAWEAPTARATLSRPATVGSSAPHAGFASTCPAWSASASRYVDHSGVAKASTAQQPACQTAVVTATVRNGNESTRRPAIGASTADGTAAHSSNPVIAQGSWASA